MQWKIREELNNISRAYTKVGRGNMVETFRPMEAQIGRGKYDCQKEFSRQI